MNRTGFIQIFGGLFFLLTVVQCTSTRWTVADLNAVDESEEPEVISSREIVLVSDSITTSNPYLRLNLYEINELQYNQRVLAERTVQQYRPKWGFKLLGLLGASVAFYAGNTDSLIDNISGKQSLALNVTGGLLAVIALTNMKPVGEAIKTGETTFLRRSGTETRIDTFLVNEARELEAEVEITYNGKKLLTSSYESTGEDGMRLGLANLVSDTSIRGDEPGEFEVKIVHEAEESRFTIPVSTFMSPVVVVTGPIAELREVPAYDNRVPLTEVGSGSEFILLDKSADGFYEAQFGGSNVFIDHASAELQWKPEEIVSDPAVVIVEEPAFGEISVEYSVPVLKAPGSSDLGLLLSNHSSNHIGTRRHLERDYRLMELYFRDAFGVSRDDIHHIGVPDEEPLTESIIELAGNDSLSTVYLYMGGFARIAGQGEERSLELVHIDENGRETSVNIEELLKNIASVNTQNLVAFIDLDFQHDYAESSVSGNDNGAEVYRRIADRVTKLNENSALVFSSRPDQKSGLYESVRFEQNYHHLFPYYIAQALQQRRTLMSDLVRYIENQVEFTSRRLHDRPQSVQAFGNLSINLAE